MSVAAVDAPAFPSWLGRFLGAEAIDAGFVLGLAGLGLVGFRSLYGGSAYLGVGLVGVALGIVVTHVARRWGQPVVAEALVTIVAFLLLGGALAAPSTALGGLLPTGGTIRDLGHVGVYGWKELLTTASPVGDSFNLLALPYVLGLVGGVAGQSLARRTRSAALPLLGPGLVLAMSILFGPRHPVSLLLQGAAFAAVALAWAGVRYHRFRPTVAGSSVRLSRDRALIGAALLLAASGVAAVVGPHLPGAGRSRVVLSRYVVPPFEANQQPSPLAGFRQYVKGAPRNKAALFSIGGARPGTLVRIATMDSYDGIVWGFAAGAPGTRAQTGDAFQRFGSTIPAGQPGPTTRTAVRIDALGGVWLPSVGETTSVSFAGPGASSLTDGFRYDTATATAAEPDGLRAGNRYTLTSTVSPMPTPHQLAAAGAGDETVSISNVPSVLQTDASQWAGGATSAWEKVTNIATHLRTTGYYSDGTDLRAGAGSPILSTPGHGEGRLATFLQGGGLVGKQIVGDDEQYAATLALMANQVGVPARVVLGAQVPVGGVVTGADVHAWVEVALAGYGWVPINWTAFLPSRPASATPPQQAPQAFSAAQVQPPVASALRSPLDDQLAGTSTSSVSHAAPPHRGPGLPAWLVAVVEAVSVPLLVVLVVVGSITGMKRRRRSRRIRSATPSSRMAGAWAELLDVARDIGIAVPVTCTRREQAALLGTGTAAPLALRVDAAVFSPGNPSDQQVDEYWEAIRQVAREIRATVGRLSRLRASLSLRSFRGHGVGRTPR